jgi:hypothetical protein
VFYCRGVSLATDADRIRLAWLTGAASRHAAMALAGRADGDDAAVAELRGLATGRADLLAQVARTATSKGDAKIPYDVQVGQEVARLCSLALRLDERPAALHGDH